MLLQNVGAASTGYTDVTDKVLWTDMDTGTAKNSRFKPKRINVSELVKTVRGIGYKFTPQS